MSFDSVAKVSKLKVGNSTAKHVLLELALFENRKTGLCCPSLATLCESTELGKTAVRSAIKYLVDNKMIKARPINSEKGNVIRTEYDLICVQGVSREDTRVYRETIQGVSDNDTCISDNDTGISENDIGVYREATPNKEIEQGIKQGNKNKDIDASPDKPKKTKKPKKAQEPLVFPDDVPEAIREEWIRYKKRQSGYLTQRMINHITREAKKVGFTTSQAMEYQMDRNWIGFEASYVKDKNGNTNAKKRADKDRWCTAENADDWDLIYGPMPTGANR